jgi:hypothetical protein
VDVEAVVGLDEGEDLRLHVVGGTEVAAPGVSTLRRTMLK